MRLIIPIVTLVLCFAGCASNDADTSGIKVVATTTQIGALTRAVAGDHVRLVTLLKAGASAHDYDPGTEALKHLGSADLVLRNGIGLDDWLQKSIKNAGGKQNVVVVTAGIEPAKREGGAQDAHVWHDVDNAKKMVDNIATALAAADPGNAQTYAAKAQAYKQRLDETDLQVRDLIESIPPSNRKMVTNHDAFGYFIDRYGLTFVAAIIPGASAEGEPSAKDLAALHRLIEREHVRAIFAEDEIDPKVAREIAGDTGVRIVDDLYADSLGPPGSGADTVDGMLLWNARKIAEALR